MSDPEVTCVEIDGDNCLVIPVRDGEGWRFAVVDVRDAAVAAYKWVHNRDGYPYRHAAKAELARTKLVSMHRHIIGDAAIGNEIDHRDRDRYNCRRRNLRIANRLTNAHNLGNSKANTSGAKGVRFHHGGWEAFIGSNGKFFHLGRFKSREHAIAARAEAELLHWGAPA